MGAARQKKSWIWWLLAGIPAVLAADALIGLAYRTDTNSDITVIASRSGTVHRAIVVFPGYVMSGETLGQAFAPYMADDDAMVVVNYAERGVDVEQIFCKVMVALERLKPVEVRVYGASMGGMVGKLFLDRYRQAGVPYGRVTLILDSAPASQHNIKRSSFFFDVSCWYRGGPLSSLAWAVVSKFGPNPPSENDADQAIIRAARHAGAWVGTPAATSQACFIARFRPLKHNELLDVVQQLIYLQGSSPNDDPLVRIPSAIADWRIAFPSLGVVTMPGRNGRWHLPLVEYPRETVRAITAAHP